MRRIAALLALVVGCSSPPPVKDYDAGGARSADPGAQGAAESRSVSGLTLDQALRMAEETHPDLAAARAAVAAASAKADQSGRYPNPVVTARGEAIGDSESTQILLGAEQRIPLGGRLAAASRADRLEADRRRHEAETVRVLVRGRVHSAFATVLFAEEAARLRGRASGMAREAAGIGRKRLEAGDALPEDIARLELEVIHAELEEDKAAGLRELAVLALAAAMGDSNLRIQSLEGNLEATLEVPALEGLLERLNQDAWAGLADADLAAARARVDLAEVERIPDLHVELLYRRAKDAGTNSLDAGLALAIPLFDSNEGRIREALAGVAEAHARGRAMRNERTRNLREAHAIASRAGKASRILRDEILPRSEAILKGAEARHSLGDVSLAEILLIRSERTLMQLAYLESLRDLMEAWAALRPFLKEQ